MVGIIIPIMCDDLDSRPTGTWDGAATSRDIVDPGVVQMVARARVDAHVAAEHRWASRVPSLERRAWVRGFVFGALSALVAAALGALAWLSHEGK